MEWPEFLPLPLPSHLQLPSLRCCWFCSCCCLETWHLCLPPPPKNCSRLQLIIVACILQLFPEENFYFFAVSGHCSTLRHHRGCVCTLWGLQLIPQVRLGALPGKTLPCFFLPLIIFASLNFLFLGFRGGERVHCAAGAEQGEFSVKLRTDGGSISIYWEGPNHCTLETWAPVCCKWGIVQLITYPLKAIGSSWLLPLTKDIKKQASPEVHDSFVNIFSSKKREREKSLTLCTFNGLPNMHRPQRGVEG